MKLSSTLKNLIKTHGIAVTALARSTGVPTQTIHNWLSGAKPRDVDQLKLVADHFGVSLDYLLYETKSEKKNFSDFSDDINAGIFEVILRKVKKN